MVDKHKTEKKVKEKKGFFQKRRESIARGLGMSFLVDAGSFMQNIVRGFLNVPYMEQRESFEQAVRRLRLSPADLEKRRKSFLQQSILFLLFGLLIFAYAVYLFAESAWGSGVVALLMTGVFVLYAFRAHFWAFQIKYKKLGCTWKEWWENKIINEKPNQEIMKK